MIEKLLYWIVLREKLRDMDDDCAALRDEIKASSPKGWVEVIEELKKVLETKEKIREQLKVEFSKIDDIVILSLLAKTNEVTKTD